MNMFLADFSIIKQVLDYGYFASIVLGALALFDFLLLFKRPRHFKITFALFLVTLWGLDVLLWVEVSFHDLVAWSPLINFGIWVTGLLTLSIITEGRVSKWIAWTVVMIFLLNCYNYYMLRGYMNLHLDRRAVFLLRIVEDFPFVQLIRFAQRIILLIAVFRLYQVVKKIQSDRNLYGMKLKRWLRISMFLVIFVVFCNNVVAWWVVDTPYYFEFSHSIYAFFCAGLFLNVIYRPEFLNNHEVNKFDFRRYILADQLSLNDQNFFVPFFQEMYYLNTQATIEHYCKQNKILESDQFNEQIIQRYKMSFSQLVNKKRVEYFVALAKNPSYSHYSIEALAKESGFNSRTALYKPFKKFHGGTPIDLITAVNRR
ncbi:helix-turn-helix domain-containing protein [Aquirufa sp. TARAVU-A1A]